MGRTKIAPSQRKSAKGAKTVGKMIDASLRVGKVAVNEAKKGYNKPVQKPSSNTGCASVFLLFIPVLFALLFL